MPPVRRSKRIQPKYQPVSGLPRGHGHSTTSSPKPTRKPKPKPSYLRRNNHDTDANLNTRLFSLPRELFDEIVALLSPIAGVCLTLTCKAALHAIGTAAWTKFRRIYQPYDQPSDLTLCELLHRDLQGLEYCVRCGILHPPLKAPHAHRSTKFTKLCFGQTASMDFWPQTPLGGYSVVLLHIAQAFESRPHDLSSNPTVDLFSGDFTTPQGPLHYRLQSSASWVDRSLVMRQEYHLSTSSGSPLMAEHITTLPLRVCAHLTTSTLPPSTAYRSTKSSTNGSLLTHAIVTAFPESHRHGVAKANGFRKPAPSEEAQMVASEYEKEFIYRCRSCPTKFRMQYSAGSGGQLTVVVWHCFGKEMYKALEYWKMFVRREGPNLGPKKRNSEFYVQSRSIPDFAVE
ncbi:hypothetical protein BDW74DRAFT_120491 [Aspergillus multicolor]|uniref:uncharacterized protein n=1 Tax=Aspergillus multicolor TaxID=41759 RepID=UPI003CCD8498